MTREEPGPPADGTQDEREIRDRRERSLAEKALRLHGLEASRLGLLGHRLERLGAMPFKSLFRLRSVLKQDFTLHMYRGVGTNPHGSPKDLRSQVGRSTMRALRSQVQWMEALRAGGLAVPEPVPTMDGAPLSVVSAGGPRSRRRCILMAWVAGIPLGDGPFERVRAQSLRSAGAYLARMHSVSEGFSVPGGFLRPEWGLGHIYGSSAPLWRRGAAVYSTEQMDVFRRAASRVSSELASLGNGRDVFGMVHADPHVRNLLVSDESSGWKGISAVDFDRSGWGYYLYDLAVTLISMERRLHPRTDILVTAREALLEGYFSERPPSSGARDAHLAAFEALRLSELVSRVSAWDRPHHNPWGSRLLAEAPVRLARFLDEGELGPPGSPSLGDA